MVLFWLWIKNCFGPAESMEILSDALRVGLVRQTPKNLISDVS
jgi:hypothetical protein